MFAEIRTSKDTYRRKAADWSIRKQRWDETFQHHLRVNSGSIRSPRKSFLLHSEKRNHVLKKYKVSCIQYALYAKVNKINEKYRVVSVCPCV